MNNRQTTKRYLPLLWLCLVALLMSCGTMRKASSSQKTPAEEQKDPLTPEQRRKYDYFFLEALRMKEKGDLDAAFEMYSHCLDIYPQGAATLYEIAKFYMFLNQPDKGERALKEAVAADPNNYWYNQTLAAYYQNKGEAAKAIYVYEDMVSHFPKRLEPLMSLVDLYNRTKDYQQVINTLNAWRNVMESPRLSVWRSSACIWRWTTTNKRLPKSRILRKNIHTICAISLSWEMFI